MAWVPLRIRRVEKMTTAINSTSMALETRKSRRISWSVACIWHVRVGATRGTGVMIARSRLDSG